MSSYRLTVRASRHLLGIFRFSIEMFGERQAEKYRAELHHVLTLLADRPGMGRLAPRVGKDVRRHEHGSHVIFYREDSDGVLIVGVVHAHRIRGLRF